MHGPGGNKIRKTAFNSVDSVCTRHVENSLEAVSKLYSLEKGMCCIAPHTFSNDACTILCYYVLL